MVQIPGSGGGGAPTSHFGSPAGTDWLVGWQDFTSNENMVSVNSEQFGPFDTDISWSGTGGHAFHMNTFTDTDVYGVRDYTLGSSTSAFAQHRTDVESINLGGNLTWRVGCRVKLEAIPVSGAENYYWYLGLNSHANILATTYFSVLGISLTDNATNFVVQNHGGSGETVTDTGVAFAAGTYFTAELEVGPGALMSAWIDGVLVADGLTTNVPATGTVRHLAHLIAQRVGVSNTVVRRFEYDWAYYAVKSSSARGTLGSGGPWG